MCVRDDHLSRHAKPHLSLLTAFPIQTDIVGGLQHDNPPFYITFPRHQSHSYRICCFHGIFGRVSSSRWYGTHLEITSSMSERQCSSSLQSFPLSFDVDTTRASITGTRLSRGRFNPVGKAFLSPPLPSDCQASHARLHGMGVVVVAMVAMGAAHNFPARLYCTIVRRWFSSGPVSLYLTERSDQVMHLICGGTCHHVLWHMERANFPKENGRTVMMGVPGMCGGCLLF